MAFVVRSKVCIIVTDVTRVAKLLNKKQIFEHLFEGRVKNLLRFICLFLRYYRLIVPCLVTLRIPFLDHPGGPDDRGSRIIQLILIDSTARLLFTNNNIQVDAFSRLGCVYDLVISFE